MILGIRERLEVMKYNKIIMEEALEVIIDYRGKTPKKSESGVQTLSAKSVKNNYIDYSKCYFISKEEYNKFMVRGLPQKGDILLTTEAPLGLVAKLDRDNVAIAQRLLTLRGKKGVLDNDYLLYYLQSPKGQYSLKARESGTTVTGIKQAEFRKIELYLPDYEIQLKIGRILNLLNDKIELNNKINKNLEQQAQAVFDNMFPDISDGINCIGDIITPKRGKVLLAKDAIYGNIPVIAGGLEPATYHNISNTVAPVITISSSGANAGFVNLWHISVWSSDSSFIDSSMTNNVYFWYVLLKKRQKEIFDSQTGSAQPHIYPKHIAAMCISELNQTEIDKFTEIVNPLFKKVRNNKIENDYLVIIRDTLLTKLMSGEIDISEIDI